MKSLITLVIAMVLLIAAYCQQTTTSYNGTWSIGSRNTISSFNHDNALGKGIGAQFRLQLSNRINSEWYLDYITSNTNLTVRNDYHIGWSLLFYLKNNSEFTNLLQPYLIAGHCFDKTNVFEKINKTNSASRLSIATQAGLGTHINITSKFDCSISSQYMLHFGKDIATNIINEKLVIQKTTNTDIDGHLLFTISLNYKLKQLWQ